MYTWDAKLQRQIYKLPPSNRIFQGTPTTHIFLKKLKHRGGETWQPGLEPGQTGSLLLSPVACP